MPREREKFFPKNEFLERLFLARHDHARSVRELNRLARIAGERELVLPRIIRDGGFLPGLIRARGIAVIRADGSEGDFFHQRDEHFAATRHRRRMAA